MEAAQVHPGTTPASEGKPDFSDYSTHSNARAASGQYIEQEQNAAAPRSSRHSSSSAVSPHRAARSRTAKDNSTQSPAASQPPSRMASPHKDSAASASGEPAGPSPYGTRSRNRNASRPNYAEDRDDSMDFEYSSSKKSQTQQAAAQKPQGTEMQRGSSSQGRRAAASGRASQSKNVEPSSNSPTQEGARIPGTSSFSVKDEAPPVNLKKRKAPSASSASASTSNPPPAKRRASAITSTPGSPRLSNMATFENCDAQLAVDGTLHADDGVVYRPNDFVYLVCEPPGEPYYIARIMEFLHVDNQPGAPIDSIRINWVYRPKDIGRKATDSRLLFASMHSDPCPLTSLRGKCNVQHRTEIDDFDRFRKLPDNFYYSQMYDRYMRRYYEVIPTKLVINVPERVKKALDERWQYVVVEIGRAKELTSAIKTCKRCAGYCANSDSVDCAVCKLTYHMQCVQPPLLKKPSRGFGWSCGPCSRKQERKLEARSTPMLGEKGDDEDEEVVEEDEDHGHSSAQRSSSPESVDAKDEEPKATKEQLAQADLWPYRYLGIHCKVEDSVDYDDRIYPRSSSRLGPRHQANVNIWHGHPVEYVKPAEVRRKYAKATTKKDNKLSKDQLAAIAEEKEAREKRPKWVLDEPPGFVRRGEDHPNDDSACTAKLLWRPPPPKHEMGERSERGMDDSPFEGLKKLSDEQKDKLISGYMARARKIAPSLGLKEYHTNFLDRALQLLFTHKFDSEAALKELKGADLKKDLKEPKLTKEELRKFEEGVTKYGSNMVEVTRHIGKIKQYGDIVRFYYMWKKSERGRQIWGNYEGRKSKKQITATNTALADDVADDYDDSAFDAEKASRKKRGFECKHCGTRTSRFWRRAPGVPPGATVPVEAGQKATKDRPQHLMVALCQRCAGLYRKYALHWEDIDDVAKRVAQTGGRAFKRKQDEELLIELIIANEESQVAMTPLIATAAAQLGMEVPPSLIISPEEAARRKKQEKALPAPEKEVVPQPSPPEEVAKKKVVEKPPEPQLVPERPVLKKQPCAVCLFPEDFGDQFWRCRHCFLTVHRRCYGIAEGKNQQKWLCDPCRNDATGQYSTCYECVLCPVRSDPAFELYEPPKPNHKKKTDREREKERLEKILVQEETVRHNKRQEEMGWPLVPREPLKPTANNNWVHVACAVFTSQVRFRNPQLLEVVEGTNAIPIQKFEQECKICQMKMGACVSCYKCPNTFHVTCAQMRNFVIGFDISPVKSSRKDAVTTVQMGEEQGSAEAIICCRDHALKSIIHLMTEPQADGQTNALQVYARYFKQADLSLTGTVRKAAAINTSIRAGGLGSNRRSSLTNGLAGTATRASRLSPGEAKPYDESDGDGHVNAIAEAMHKECANCRTEASPRWHEREVSRPNTANGTIVNGSGSEREYVCHRCFVQKLKRAPSPPSTGLLSQLPKDFPTVSEPTPQPAQTWAGPPPPHVAPYEAAPSFDQRASVPLATRYAPHAPAYVNGIHSGPAATPPAAQHVLPRLGGHTSPPAPSLTPAPNPTTQQQQSHIPPPHPSAAPPQQHSVQPSPMTPYGNGYPERRDISAPPPPVVPLPRMQPPPVGPPPQANGPLPPPPPQAHPPPFMPTLNRGPPELERRYSQAGAPPPSALPSPSFAQPRHAYPPSSGGGTTRSPRQTHMTLPVAAMPAPPSSRGRELNGAAAGFRESMVPPRGADPFAEGHDRSPPRERLNGASASPSLKNLIH